jgi:hypothetical protein
MSMHKWIADNIPLYNVIFKSSNHTALWKAVIDGMVIGLISAFLALENNDLELVMPLIHEWRSDLWVVTQYTVVCYQLLLSIVLSVYYSVMQY